MIEALRFSETSVLIRAIGSNIPEDGILYLRTVTILDIIHRHVFDIKHNVSNTGFYCLHVGSTQVYILVVDLCYVRFINLNGKVAAGWRQTSSIYWSILSRFHLKAERESSLRNSVC
jgi:hypothetical protein